MDHMTKAEADAYLSAATEYKTVNLEWATVYTGRHPEHGLFLMTRDIFGDCHIKDGVTVH